MQQVQEILSDNSASFSGIFVRRNIDNVSNTLTILGIILGTAFIFAELIGCYALYEVLSVEKDQMWKVVFTTVIALVLGFFIMVEMYKGLTGLKRPHGIYLDGIAFFRSSISVGSIYFCTSTSIANAELKINEGVWREAFQKNSTNTVNTTSIPRRIEVVPIFDFVSNEYFILKRFDLLSCENRIAEDVSSRRNKRPPIVSVSLNSEPARGKSVVGLLHGKVTDLGQSRGGRIFQGDSLPETMKFMSQLIEKTLSEFDVLKSVAIEFHEEPRRDVGFLAFGAVGGVVLGVKRAMEEQEATKKLFEKVRTSGAPEMAQKLQWQIYI